MLEKINHIYLFFKYYILSKYNIRGNINKKKLALLKHLNNKSIFYANLKSIDLAPIIDKIIMNEQFDNINTVGFNFNDCLKFAKNNEKFRDFKNDYKNYSIGMSSGTTGHPSVFILSKEEKIKWLGTILGKTISLIKKEKIALFLRNNNNLYEQLNCGPIKFLFFDLFNNIDENIEKLNNYKPSILLAPAQVLKYIAINNKLNYFPNKVYNIAEVLDDHTKSICEDYYKTNILQIYQATEGFLGISCKNGNLHLNEDNIIFDKVFLDSDRFIPIITDLERYTQPFVKYKMNDILHIDNKKCNCGNNNTIIKKIEGRDNDTIYLKNNNGVIITIFSDYLLKIISNYINNQTEFNLCYYGNNKFILYINDSSYINLIKEMTLIFKDMDINIEIIKEDFKYDFYNKRRKIINYEIK